MKRPLLIAILLLIALSAAPACAIKERAVPAMKRADRQQVVALFIYQVAASMK